MRVILMTLAIASLVGCDNKKDSAAQAAGAAPAATPAGAVVAGTGEAATAAASQAVDDAAEAASNAGAADLEAGGQAMDEAAAGRVSSLGGSRVIASVQVPADFPIQPPAGSAGITYGDLTEDGKRTRVVQFGHSGSPDELAAQFEKIVRDKGLQPKISKVDMGGVRMTSLEATKDGLSAGILITEKAPGSNIVLITWGEQ